MGRDRKHERTETLAVHSGERRPGPEGSVVFPIYQGTVYAVDPGTDYHDIKYIRLSTTPSQRYLHDKLAALEGAEAALATASGMAAVTTALLALLKTGDHLLVGHCGYGGTHTFVTEETPRFGWTYDFIDPHRPESWAALVKPSTKVILVETITNPLMRVPRLAEVAAFARARGLTSIIDNTFASPVNFRPLEHGYDLVFHSATKYLNGHSDVVAGCVMGATALVEQVRRTLNHVGGTLDPHAAFLFARGAKTLAVRVNQQNGNALALARFLASQPKILAVNYPGLETHPDHAIAANLFAGFGGMLSFRPTGGVEAAKRLVSALLLPYIAPSLGGVETLVTRPVTTSHAGIPREERDRLGITDDLIRVSCGIEHPQDIVDDFRQALDSL